MAENVDIKLTADIGELLARLDGLEKAVGNVGKTAEKSSDVIAKSFAEATSEISGQQKAIKDIEREYERLIKAKEKTAASGKDTGAIDKQMRKTKDELILANKELVKLNKNQIAFATTTKEVSGNIGAMKKELRALGQINLGALSQKEVEGVKKRMADLTEGIRDFREQTVTASESGLPGVIFGIQGLASGAQLATGAMSLFGGETEKLEKTMLQLIGITQALAQVEDAYSKGKFKTMIVQSQAIAMSAREKIATLAATISTNAQTKAEAAKAVVMGKASIATKAITALQWAWNAAIAANPIGLLIAGIVALGAAIAGLAYYFSRGTDDVKGYEKALDGTVIKNKELREEHNKSVLELKKLQIQYKLLSGELNEYQAQLATLKLEYSATMKSIQDETEERLDNIENNWSRHFGTLGELYNLFDKERDRENIREEQRIKENDAINQHVQEKANARMERFAKIREKLEEKVKKQQEKNNTEARKGIDLEALRIEAMDEGYFKAVELLNKETESRKNAAKENAKTVEEYNKAVEYLTEIHYDKLIALQKKYLGELDEDAPIDDAALDAELKPLIDRYNREKELAEEAAMDADKARMDRIDGEREFDEWMKGVWKERIQGLTEIAGELKGVWEKQLDNLIKNNQQYIDLINTRIAETERGIQREIDARNQGYASDVTAQEQQLAKLQQLRAKALADQQRYVKQQQRIESLQQAIDLTSTAAKLLKQWVGTLPPPFGLIAGGASIAAMYALFQNAKAKSLQNTQFEKGGWGVLGGERHSNGGTIIPGIGEAEKGEMVGIFSRQKTAKYGDSLGTLVDAINLDNVAMLNKALGGMFGAKTATDSINLDDSEYLRGIYEHTKRVNGWQTVEVNKNYKVVKKGNMTKKIYIN